MAGGGKETPRQKMIGMMYLVLTALLAMNVSKQILKGYITVNESMEKSKKNLAENNKRVQEAFQNTIAGNAGAKPYYDKALEAQKEIDEVFKYLDEVKVAVIKHTEGLETGADTAQLRFMQKIDDYDAPTFVLIGSDAATPENKPFSAVELAGKLSGLNSKLVGLVDKMQTESKTKLLKDDYESLKKKFESIKPVDSGAKEDGITMTWPVENFYHLPLAAVICNLNKMQADLKNVEAEILQVFSGASGKLAIKFDNIVARVVAPSSYIQAGQPYSANIFLAASSSKLAEGDMEILLNVDSAAAASGAKGETVPLVNGEGVYTTPTGAEGDKEYKGVIKYKNPDGSFKYYPFSGNYKVAKAAASVSADQMNVFYSGVPNPVTAAAAGISPADILVSATGSGVRVSPKGNGKFEFNFSGIGECMVSVSAKTKDGVKSQGPPFKFRVKPLPKPDIKVGGKFAPPEMKKSDLAVVSAIGAGASGFDFQANYIVQSLEVTGKVKGKLIQGQCVGSSLSGDALSIFKGADPNTKIYVDAKIKGPDGKITNTTTGIKVIK